MLTRNERIFAFSGNWSHGVSNDLVSWFLVEDALDSGPKDSAFPDVGPVRAATNLPPAPHLPRHRQTAAAHSATVPSHFLISARLHTTAAHL